MNHIYTNPEFGEDWFNYAPLYDMFVASVPNNSTIVEVGCWKGKSVAYLGVTAVNSGKNIKIFAVDTWTGSGDVHAYDEYIKSNSLYDLFVSNITPLKSVITPIRKPSVEASKEFADGSLDAIFIDADHEYSHVKADIAAWYPKLKKGGIIAGHDYDDRPNAGIAGVGRAVNEFFGKLNISVVLGNCWIYNKPN